MVKHTVEIIKINWVERTALEAEIIFKLGDATYSAFSHSCNFQEGEIVDVYFDFVVSDSNDDTFFNGNDLHLKKIIQDENQSTSYKCYGQIKSIHPLTIDCGTISLTFGDWINDDRVIGWYVYFKIFQLEISKI